MTVTLIIHPGTEDANDLTGSPRSMVDLEQKRVLKDFLRKGETVETVENLVLQGRHLRLKNLTVLAHCERLRKLDCSRNSIESLAGGESLCRLEKLNLSDNKISDLSEILHLQSLFHLFEVKPVCMSGMLSLLKL